MRYDRELFMDAEKDMKENGDDADLHIIIFDEIDAICKVCMREIHIENLRLLIRNALVRL